MLVIVRRSLSIRPPARILDIEANDIPAGVTGRCRRFNRTDAHYPLS